MSTQESEPQAAPAATPEDAARRLRLALGLVAVAVLAAAAIGAYFSLHERGVEQEALRAARTLPFARAGEPQPLPEIRFQDGAGRMLSLADFRGKVVLLNLWATWCPPCRKEMPTLDRLQAKLGGPDFEVLALSLDDKGAEAVRAFYREIGVRSLQTYVDSSMHAADALHVPGVPTTLLVDPSGREIGRHLGPAEWDSAPVVALLRERIAALGKAAGKKP